MLIDTTKTQTIADHAFDCIGSGRLDLALRADYQAALRQVQQDIGFTYIRAHGMFSKQMGIYQAYEQDGKPRVLYNFTYLDQVYDFFQSVHIKPFVELGFMPEQIASGDDTVFWWQGNITPPKKMADWVALVQATLQHVIDRYGIDEVATWPIEVWNEPNLDGFWRDADQKAYFDLYEATSKAVKAVDARLQVGGPALCGGSDWWLRDFLQFCEAKQLPLDFLSRHTYSVKEVQQHGLLVEQEMLPVDTLFNDFKTGHDYLAQYYHKQMPVYISEFNTSYASNNPVHDGSFNAAFLAPVISRGSELAESYSYWTFSDVFEENGIPASFLHGGFGLMTQRGLKKPTYYLYQFFAQLSDQLLYRDDHVHVGIGKDGSIIAIAWNAENQPFDLSLTLSGLQAPRYAQHTRLVDEHHGNIDSAWRAMGRPRFPNLAQLLALKQLSHPADDIQSVVPNQGQLTLNLQVPANSVQMVQLAACSLDDATY